MFDAIAVLLFVGVYKLSHHFYSIVNCVHAQIIWHCTEEEFATYGPLFIMQIMKDYDEVSIVQASDATFVPTPSICVDNWNSPCQPPTHTNTFVAINLHLPILLLQSMEPLSQYLNPCFKISAVQHWYAFASVLADGTPRLWYGNGMG